MLFMYALKIKNYNYESINILNLHVLSWFHVLNQK